MGDVLVPILHIYISLEKVKLSPKKLPRLCEDVHAKDCREIRGLRAGLKRPPNWL